MCSSDLKRLKMKNNLYKDAIAKFGQVMQITMFFEEASELIKELTKELRGKGNRENIAEEIADVEIMLEQLKTIFNNNDLIQEFKIEKLKRLEKILKNKNKENL